MIALVTLHNIIKIEKWFNIILKLFKYRISNNLMDAELTTNWYRFDTVSFGLVPK